MFSVGDVIGFYSRAAGKHKFHLCISLNGHYLFVNTQDHRAFHASCVFPCSDFPFLSPTESGLSAVSCSIIMKMTDADLRRCGAVKKGSVSPVVLKKIIEFVRTTDAIPDEDRDEFLETVGDWA
jgi:hypothetical protein